MQHLPQPLPAARSIAATQAKADPGHTAMVSAGKRGAQRGPLPPGSTELVLELGARPNGVSAGEVETATAVDRCRARVNLHALTDAGKLIRAKGGWNGLHLRWFVHAEDAQRYEKSIAWRAPTNGLRSAVAQQPTPRQIVTHGIASGCDQRYQCTTVERELLRTDGAFSRLRIGQYEGDAASCAAMGR